MTTTIPCPHRIAGTTTCGDEGGELAVTLEWTPGERWGTDADGNRGVWMPGSWSVLTVAETCGEGCTLTTEEHAEADAAAEAAALDVEVVE